LTRVSINSFISWKLIFHWCWIYCAWAKNLTHIWTLIVVEITTSQDLSGSHFPIRIMRNTLPHTDSLSNSIFQKFNSYLFTPVIFKYQKMKKEKRLSWRQLCSNFITKTPTAKIWRFVRSNKAKSLSSETAIVDQISQISQDTTLNKLCPFFLSSLLLSFSWWVKALKSENASSSNLFHWIDDPFSFAEFDSPYLLQKEFVSKIRPDWL